MSKCSECSSEKLRAYHVTFECENGHRYEELVSPAEEEKPHPKMSFSGRRTQEPEEPGDTRMRMPFGKYKGWLLEDIPVDYFQWALGNMDNLRDSLRSEMENQIALKAGKGVRRR